MLHGEVALVCPLFQMPNLYPPVFLIAFEHYHKFPTADIDQPKSSNEMNQSSHAP